MDEKKYKYRGYTPAQAAAAKNYMSKQTQIKITVTPEFKERAQNHAKSKGVSLTSLIVDLVNKDIEANS